MLGGLTLRPFVIAVLSLFKSKKSTTKTKKECNIQYWNRTRVPYET